ncbi:MAG: sulfotransferase [Steroidobacteraceae bacterium]
MAAISAQAASELTRAEALCAQRRFAEAEAICQSLLSDPACIDASLQRLVDIYRASGRTPAAIATFTRLIDRHPDDLHFYAHLADYLHVLGQDDAAIACYRRLLDRQPRDADAHYNLALLLKRCGRYEPALAAYRTALACGITSPEEAHLNMGVIYSALRQEERAIREYRTALELNPGYLHAMFNLGGALEESGERDQAIALYQKVVDLDPGYCAALARLAELVTATSTDHPLISRIERELQNRELQPAVRRDLLFALGKLLDEAGSYDEAFQAYAEANQINRASAVNRYDRRGFEQWINELIRFFCAEWFAARPAVSAATPIFVCGMFRSGSTLVEQILAGHPAVVSGGELDYFPNLVRAELSPFPAALRHATRAQLETMADRYLAFLRERFPAAERVTDKRPDNVLNLGLILTLFPRARIVCTTRQSLDNCLSVYFQALSDVVPYATDLLDIGHYYVQQARLISHWKATRPGNIHEVNYDALLASPRPVVTELLKFCGLEWHDDCLEFHRIGNVVKTASLWQVRQPLYTRSSGRWRHYAKHLSQLQTYLRDALGPEALR